MAPTVEGESTNTAGVFGKSLNQSGVFGQSKNWHGVAGVSGADDQAGVYGGTDEKLGVFAETGVWGQSNPAEGKFDEGWGVYGTCFGSGIIVPVCS